ncbi:MAG: DUF1285 domain-containing protein [Gammaproteobacteria bacterium]|nr:DUF1285 domain-containing protein [Gammaproteobacteria bacterium]
MTSGRDRHTIEAGLTAADVMSELEQILSAIESGESLQAGRRHWNPRHRGEIDIRIAADGGWFHEGRRFQRDAMVKMFAGILRREDSGYYLVTPVEKLRIQVEDAPFIANLVECIEDDGKTAIVFTTNIEERIVVDADHAIRVEIDADTREPRPYVHFRDGLEALIGRSAFFDLLNLAHESTRDGGHYLTVTSMGQEFELGSADEQSD